VVTWSSNNQDGLLGGAFAQRFSSAGLAVGAEFQVNTFTASTQDSPKVAADADGDFVVTWWSNNQDGSNGGIFAQRFSSAGSRVGVEFQVNTFTTLFQIRPSVAAAANGDFVVAWESGNQDGAGYGIFGQRFSSTGAAVGVEFQVNTFTASTQAFPSMAANTNGDFVVAWRSTAQDGSGYGVFAQSFSSAGTRVGPELQVNTFTMLDQHHAVASAAAGAFVVAWASPNQDGSSLEVFAQRLGPPKVLDIDANGSVIALGDGLLVVRYLFGFTGTTLVTGAVDEMHCDQCTALEIQMYLAPLV
jgi:hypothetical protein